MREQPPPDCKLSGPPPYHCEGCDLSGVNLAGKDLRQANLKNTTLRGTIFKGAACMDSADLSGATMGEGTDFSGCDLSKVIFSARPTFGSNPQKSTRLVGATIPYQPLGYSWWYLDLTAAKVVGLPDDLSRLDVRECRLSGIALAGKTLKNAHFYHADLTGADFSGGILNNIVFSGQCDLTGAKFIRAQIPSGVFDTATLTETDFSDAITLAYSMFLNARMDGTRFDGIDLTTCTFSAPPRFSSDPNKLTSFRRATLNFSTIQKQWSYLDLTGTTLVGLAPSVDLTYLAALYSVLTGLDLSGYTLEKSNLSGATLTGTQFRGAKMSDALLRGAQGTQPRFDGATLVYTDFSPDHGRRTSLRGAVFSGATLTHVDLSRADLSPANPKDRSTAAQFKQAKMNNAVLSQVDLTGADLTGGVLLHSADLSNSTLKDADLSGAQLGGYSEVFRVPQTSSAYAQFLTALKTGDPSGVSAIFKQEGYPLATEKTTDTTDVPDRFWTVVDNASQSTYLVLNWSASDSTTFLVVSSPTPPASLVGAYMPNAKLLDANLYKVDASHVQLYRTGNAGAAGGSGQQGLAGAVLDGIVFANANLGSLDLTGASLYGAVMTNASLINAILRKVALGQATLAYSNLAGADLTDASLDGTSLSNAAVSTRLDASTTGVHLFSVQATDSNCARVLGELQAATKLLNLVPDGDAGTLQQLLDTLNAGNLDALRPVFQTNNVTFPARAAPASRDPGVAWEIVDPAPGPAGNYTICEGYDDLGEQTLLARPSVPLLQQLFHDNIQITLRWQASVNAGVSTGVWRVDNDSENPHNLQLGYMTYSAIQETDGTLSFYGTTLRVEQLGDNGQLEIRIMTYGPTIPCKTGGDGVQQCAPDGSGSYLAPDTICPNTRKLSVNQSEDLAWGQMLRGPQLPLPPTCVPSPFADCPQSSAPGLRERAEFTEGAQP